MNKYDLIIIGGGAAAFSAAIKANRLGARTAMINAGLPLGGTCVNVGCVPSKTLIHAAKVIHQAKAHNIPGLEFSVKRVDFAKIVADEQSLVAQMRADKYQSVLDSLDKVTFIHGYGKFIDEHRVRVTGAKAVNEYEADKFIIATGSRARIPDIQGLEDARYITHTDLVALKKLPESIVVIGGGAQGCEWGQMLARFGVKVTILQRSERILPAAETGAAVRLQEILEREGIDIRTNAVPTSVKMENGKKVVIYKMGGEDRRLVVDEILLTSGRTPNTDRLDLGVAGVEINNNGAIKVDAALKSSNPDIYAAGDVAGLPLRQETTAGREGSLAAQNALKGESGAIDYSTVPYAVFTDPQLAGVGLTEAEQMRRYNTCLCRTVQLKVLPKARITKQTEGLFAISANPKTEVIEGVHILAPNASDLIAAAMILVLNKNTLDDVINSIPMFPTLSEGIKYAAMSFKDDISKLSCCV